MAFESGRISNFKGLVTLTLDQVVLHTVVHQSSTSTYTRNFIEIVVEENFLWTDGHTDDGHLRSSLLVRSTQKSRPNK